MSKKKIASLFFGAILIFSSFSAVFAAEKTPAYKALDSPQAAFQKQSFFPTKNNQIKNQEIKNLIVSPEMLGAKEKGMNKKGVIPVGPTSRTHAGKPSDEITITSDGFKDPTGTNNISFSSFDYGDILLVHDGWVLWGYYRHAGMWDSDFYSGSIHDTCIWEANTTPSSDVHLTTPDKFRHYDEAVGLWVPSTSSNERYNTTWFAYNQYGESYNALSIKSNYNEWYCSKLVWAAYKEEASIDLDVDGGYSVLPDDIYEDSQAYVFVSAD